MTICACFYVLNPNEKTAVQERWMEGERQSKLTPSKRHIWTNLNGCDLQKSKIIT